MSAPFMSPSGNVRTFPWFLWESEVLTSLWWDAESSFSARGRRRLVKSWAADTCPSSRWIVSCRDGIQPAATAVTAGWTICHDPTSVYLKIPSLIPFFVRSSFSWTYYAFCSPLSLLLRRQRLSVSASQAGFTPIVCLLGSKSVDELVDSVHAGKAEFVFFRDMSRFSEWAGRNCISCDCGDCLGNISDSNNRAKWLLWKLFKATFQEQCLASGLAEKMCSPHVSAPKLYFFIELFLYCSTFLLFH